MAFGANVALAGETVKGPFTDRDAVALAVPVLEMVSVLVRLAASRARLFTDPVVSPHR